jgi:hypothetical protein
MFERMFGRVRQIESLQNKNKKPEKQRLTTVKSNFKYFSTMK